MSLRSGKEEADNEYEYVCDYLLEQQQVAPERKWLLKATNLYSIIMT